MIDDASNNAIPKRKRLLLLRDYLVRLRLHPELVNRRAAIPFIRKAISANIERTIGNNPGNAFLQRTSVNQRLVAALGWLPGRTIRRGGSLKAALG